MSEFDQLLAQVDKVSELEARRKAETHAFQEKSAAIRVKWKETTLPAIREVVVEMNEALSRKGSGYGVQILREERNVWHVGVLERVEIELNRKGSRLKRFAITVEPDGHVALRVVGDEVSLFRRRSDDPPETTIVSAAPTWLRESLAKSVKEAIASNGQF